MYRIVSNYGYGDKSWLERNLSREDVIQWFINNRGYDEDTTFEDCPSDSDYIYYYEDDNPNDEEDWDWQDS